MPAVCPDCQAPFVETTAIGGVNNTGRYSVFTCGTYTFGDHVQRRSAACMQRQITALQLEIVQLKTVAEQLLVAWSELRNGVLHEQDQLAEMNFGPDRINAILSMIDDTLKHRVRVQPTAETKKKPPKDGYVSYTR